jgi:hypothetical protein
MARSLQRGTASHERTARTEVSTSRDNNRCRRLLERRDENLSGADQRRRLGDGRVDPLSGPDRAAQSPQRNKNQGCRSYRRP